MPRPRKPNEAHVAQGTFRADRHGSPQTASDDEYLSDLPAPPDFLCESGVARWSQLGILLVRRRRLTETDLPTLELCCQQWGRIRELYECIEVKKGMCDGKLVFDDDEIRQLYRELRAVEITYKASLDSLGCNPEGRSRASIGNPTSKTKGAPPRRRT